MRAKRRILTCCEGVTGIRGEHAPAGVINTMAEPNNFRQIAARVRRKAESGASDRFVANPSCRSLKDWRPHERSRNLA